ncbi:MAG: four helix bundle protein [Deltaproteobacteria bacterium]|nr:four helix bundle protein [Deltaproteobacteria bacterium]
MQNPPLDLSPWDRSHRLTVALYRFGRCLPDPERQSLGMELARAASDVPVLFGESLRQSSRRRARALVDAARARAHEVECLLQILRELPFLNRKMLRVLLRENKEIIELLLEHSNDL